MSFSFVTGLISVSRWRAVISGRFFRVLPQPAGGDEIGEDGSGCRRESSRVPFQAGDGWRQRAGVRQLPTGDMLTLEEGFHRAFEVGDLDILFAEEALEEEPQEPAGAVMVREEAWQICASCDAQFPFLLAAYQHFTRAGWRVASGLKYGATYLLYPTDPRSGRCKEHERFRSVCRYSRQHTTWARWARAIRSLRTSPQPRGERYSLPN